MQENQVQSLGQEDTLEKRMVLIDIQLIFIGAESSLCIVYNNYHIL